MSRLKYCQDLDFDYDKHIGVKRRIAMNARMRRRRRCLNVLFLAAAATTFLAPSLINADTDNVSFYGLSGQKVEHVVTDEKTADIKRKVTVPLLAGYIGRTNSVMTSQFTIADVSYTGSWAWVDDGNGNFRIRFLTSGTFTPAKTIIIDVFLVGGGAGGLGVFEATSGAAGGGAGYTGTWSSVTLAAGVSYPVVIGAGGSQNTNGGSTSFHTTYAAAGGNAGTGAVYGGNGGSGGGAGSGGSGGTNGGNGGSASSGTRPGGTGQGTITREFGETAGALYAGAGGGGASSTVAAGVGGTGGGANGGAWGATGGSAAANTGGGGGGAGANNHTGYGGSGGSGICIIRNHR